MITEKPLTRELPVPNFKGKLIAGVDEAGRGALAGPVIAAAVILSVDLDGCQDSKQLSHKQRLELAVTIKEKAQSWAIGQASAIEIDRLNILHASLLAMRRALEALDRPPDIALVDGNHTPEMPFQTQAIIAGDARVKVISAASILAKVTRDEIMMELDKKYPNYKFAKHKGYPTKQHLEVLQTSGLCKAHRKSYRPVRQQLLFSQ